MARKPITINEAAALIRDVDPLSDVRISLGWAMANGQRLPVLRLSSKSTVDHRRPATPLGTVHGGGQDTHARLLHLLTKAMSNDTPPAVEPMTDRQIELLRLIGDTWRGDWSGSVFDGRDGRRWIETALTGTDTELDELAAELRRIEDYY